MTNDLKSISKHVNTMNVFKITSKYKKNFAALNIPLLTLISLSVYSPLISGFFIQDEWQLFSFYHSMDNKSLLQILTSFFIPQPGQYVPITQIISYLVFYIFQLNYLAYFLIGLLLHILVGILLLKLLTILTKNLLISFFGALFFLITPSHFQATSWVVTNIGYALSASLFLIGIIFYFRWLENKEIKLAFFSSMFLFLSLLAKEITIFIFLALPLLTYIWKKDFRKSIRTIFITFPVLCFGLWNYWFIKTHPLEDFNVQSSTNLFNVFTLPIRSLVESAIPQDLIYVMSKIIILATSPFTKLQSNTTAFSRATETIGAFIVVILITLIFVFLGSYIWKATRTTNRTIFKSYITGIILAAFSGLPFIFVDSSEFSLLQPRYTYIGVLGVTIMLTTLLGICIKRWPRLSLLGVISVLLIYSLITFKISNDLAQIGETRKNILATINISLPVNQRVTLIFVDSDRSYYGLPSEDHIVPFQNGLGKVLAVDLWNQVYIPRKLYEPIILWELTSQGYYKDNIGGFGYYRDIRLLQKAVKDNSIPKVNVFGFYWHSQESRLENITNNVREQL